MIGREFQKDVYPFFRRRVTGEDIIIMGSTRLLEVRYMKKAVISALFSLLMFSSIAAADTGMMDSGLGMGGMLAMSIYGLIYIAIAAFVFSAVFWWTYKWMVKDAKL